MGGKTGEIIQKTWDSGRDIVKGVYDALESHTKFLFTLDVDDLLESYQILFKDVLAPIFKPIFHFLGIRDETIYSVEVITTRLLTEETTALKNAVLNAVRGEQSIVDALTLNMTAGHKASARALYSYAQHHYVDSIPISTVSEVTTDDLTVKDILQAIEEEPVSITYVEVGVPDSLLWCKGILFLNNDYLFSDNTFELKGSRWELESVFLNAGSTAYTARISLSTYTRTLVEKRVITSTSKGIKTVASRFITTVSTYRVLGSEVTSHTSKTPTTRVKTPEDGTPDSTVFTPVSDDTVFNKEYSYMYKLDLPDAGIHYSVQYYCNTDPTTTKVWFYALDSNTYPELEVPVVTGSKDGLAVLPAIALRINDVNVNVDKNSERYKTTKRMLDILNVIDLDTLIEGIDANPDQDKVQEAFLAFGSNVYDDSKGNNLYLYSMLGMLGASATTSKADFNAMPPGLQSDNVFTFLVKQGRYNTAVSFNYIEQTQVTGVIGEVSDITKEFIILPDTKAGYLSPNAAQNDPSVSKGLVNSSLILRLQTSATEYTEIEISGLVLSTYIFTHGDSIKIKTIALVDPITSDEADRNNFIIPISLTALEKLPSVYAEVVINNGMQVLIYAEDSLDLEYYQTEAFLGFIRVLVVVIAIVILILSLGSGAELSAVLIQLATTILVQVGLTLALKEVLSHNISDEARAVAMLIYVVASVYSGNALSGDSALVFADVALMTTAAVSTALQMDFALKQQGLAEETAEQEALIKTREQELEDAQDLLDGSGGLDTESLLFGRTVPVLDTWLTPQEFVQRGLTTNVAPILLSQSRNYVASVLDLDNIQPKFNRIDTDIDSMLKLL